MLGKCLATVQSLSVGTEAGGQVPPSSLLPNDNLYNRSCDNSTCSCQKHLALYEDIHSLFMVDMGVVE